MPFRAEALEYFLRLGFMRFMVKRHTMGGIEHLLSTHLSNFFRMDWSESKGPEAVRMS